MNNIKSRKILILILAASFGFLTFLVLNDGAAAVEYAVYTGVSKYINEPLTNIMIAVTNIGSTTVILAITALLLALPKTRLEFGLPVAINTIITAGLNIALKSIIARPRPDILSLVVETGYGFPSGHAMNSSALYAIITLIVFRQTKNKKIRLSVLMFASVVTISIGISRIYLGVHNSADVLGGWIMGVTVAFLIDTIWQREARISRLFK